MAEKLNPRLVSLSLASVFGAAYAVCAAAFALAPQATLSLFKDMFHGADITKIAMASVSLESAVLGFVETVALSLAFGWLFAVVYNYLLSRMK